jgi:hypothetical protein
MATDFAGKSRLSRYRATVSEKVAVCINGPDAAVTVIVEVTGVPPLTAFVLGDFPLQPVNRVRPTTLTGSISISCRLARRFFLPTKHSTNPSDEPESHRPELLRTAAAREVFTVSVETMLPVDVTVAGEKLHVAPTGRPEQVNITDEVAEKPFVGVTVIVAVPLVPAVSERDPGETPSAKSGAGAPAADVVALAWLEGTEDPKVSVAWTA